MPTGRLGAFSPNATTNTTIYTVPVDTFAVVSLSIANRNASVATVQIALATAGTPAANGSEYLEYNTIIQGNGAFERTGIVMAAGQKLVVYSSLASVSVVAYGIETSTL